MYKTISVIVLGFITAIFCGVMTSKAVSREKQCSGKLTLRKLYPIMFRFQIAPFFVFEIVAFLIIANWSPRFAIALFFGPLAFIFVVSSLLMLMATGTNNKGLIPLLMENSKKHKQISD